MMASLAPVRDCAVAALALTMDQKRSFANFYPDLPLTLDKVM